MLPQQIVQNIGGTIETVPPLRAGAAPLVTVRSGGGAVVVNAAAPTLDSVNTTLGQAAALGDRSVVVASATGIVAGRRYRLGPADPTTATEMYEFVRVASVSGTTINLVDRLKYAHANAIPFAGTRLSYAVQSTEATILFWDGHAEWSWTGIDQHIFTGVECVLKPLVNLCTVEDVARRDHRLSQKMAATMDPQALIDNAYEDVLERLGGGFRVRTMIGDEGIVKLTAYRVLVEIASQLRDDVGEKRHEALLDQAITDLTQTRPADNNQDGAIESYEGMFATGRVDRA